MCAWMESLRAPQVLYESCLRSVMLR